ncbi:MAG: hypothetical protein WD059_04175 [Balneolaceae bacterium]
MKFMTQLILPVLSLIVLGVACSASDSAIIKSNSTPEPDERIAMTINESVHFEFEKYDTTWTGNLTVYTLNKHEEKVVQSTHISANDSTWQDFDLFVDFLNLYEIPPQNQIAGWYPDSSILPKQVYNFEVFDGDTAKSYSYQDPIKDVREYWQSQNVLVFITFVQNDLGWMVD